MNSSGNGTSPSAAAHKRTQSLSSHQHNHNHHHPVRSPSDRNSSLSKSQSPSPERSRKRANSSRTSSGHSNSVKPSNGHDDSEAETDILSDEEPPKTKVKKRVVKNEPKDEIEDSSILLKREVLSTHSSSVSNTSTPNGDATDNRKSKQNGVAECLNGHAKKSSTERPHLSNDFSKNSSRAQSADATIQSNEQNERSRQAHSVEPRKRKFSDPQRPSKLEPPRQKPRLQDVTKSATLNKGPSPPPTPGTPGLRSLHKRSASTLSNLPSAGLGSTRTRRDISSTSASLPPATKDWATSDMSSDEAASFPQVSKLAPPPRSGRAAYRAMTSPTRSVPTGKRADKFGSTPLARACEKGNLRQVKVAYEEAPGEIDQADNGGFAPLQKAALEGHTEIVQFLLEHGCRTDVCSKDEQDTPLIDAVENGHMDVVKLLLDHGVNPHHQNKSGKRAIDAVDDEEDYASELREMLLKSMQDYVGSESDSDDDNQEFPLIRPEDKNRTDLLYLEPNRANLLAYSTKGDVVAVDHFLSSVKPDNSHAVAAARGGHHLVLNLLLASAGQQLEKDPDPARYDETPLLVAIGRGQLRVIKLLLEQDDFNPTRKTKDGKTYYEVAEERHGPKWQTERDLLKEYYDAYMAKRKVQKRKRTIPDGSDKTERKAKSMQAPPTLSPEATVKEKKSMKKPPVSSPTTKEAKRRNRAVVESSDEDSDEEVRVRKKPMRERRASMVSKSSRNDLPSPAISRQSSGSKVKRTDSISKPPRDKESPESDKPTSRKLSTEKRHSTDSKMSDKSDKLVPLKAVTPEAVREARKAEEEARVLRAAENAAEAERKKREAEEALVKEAERQAEEERLRKEKEDQERKEAEERRMREQAEREEHERRVAALPTALRLAVQKGSNRPLHFRAAKGALSEELGISMQFLPIQTAPLRNIDPNCVDSKRDEQWMLNFQIAGMLGLPSGLRMSEFSHWERRPVSDEQQDLFLESYDLSKMAQEYRWPQAGEVGYDHVKITQALKETRDAFIAMEPLHWVRFSDFEDAIKLPEYKHLQSLRLRTTNCRIKEEPDSAIDISFLFDEDETEGLDDEAGKKADSIAEGVNLKETVKTPKEVV